MDEKTFLLSQSIRSNDFEGEGEGGTTYTLAEDTLRGEGRNTCTLTEGTTRGVSGRKIYTPNKRSVHVE
jgi:hypothetical protein